MLIRTAIAAAAVAGLAVQAGTASADPRIFTLQPAFGARPFAMRPFASSSKFYTFGGTLAATQRRTWFNLRPSVATRHPVRAKRSRLFSAAASERRPKPSRPRKRPTAFRRTPAAYATLKLTSARATPR
jgi:hypothetical protein